MGHVVEGQESVTWIIAFLVDKMNGDSSTGRTPVIENSIDKWLDVSKSQARALWEETYAAFSDATSATDSTAPTIAIDIGTDAKSDWLGLGEILRSFQAFIQPAVSSLHIRTHAYASTICEVRNLTQLMDGPSRRIRPSASSMCMWFAATTSFPFDFIYFGSAFGCFGEHYRSR